jgi:hypothetical protein
MIDITWEGVIASTATTKATIVATIAGAHLPFRAASASFLYSLFVFIALYD